MAWAKRKVGKFRETPGGVCERICTTTRNYSGEGRMRSPAEMRVVEMIVQGHSNAEIGEALSITEKTMKFHLTNIYAKENVTSRAQLIVKHMRDSFVTRDEIKAFKEILK
jgi:DNA-binding CsgD family transcriptional regulator